MIFHDIDTIVAPATAVGGALCVIRLSGGDAITLCDSIFKGRKPLAEAAQDLEAYLVEWEKS